jgi:hypothetical protein
MARPIEEKVHFRVTVRSYDRGDHWVAKTLETGIYTYAGSREEAEALNGEANEALIRRMKQEGQRALARFMKARSIQYRVGGRRLRTTGKLKTAWERAATNELTRAA